MWQAFPIFLFMIMFWVAQTDYPFHIVAKSQLHK